MPQVSRRWRLQRPSCNGGHSSKLRLTVIVARRAGHEHGKQSTILQRPPEIECSVDVAVEIRHHTSSTVLGPEPYARKDSSGERSKLPIKRRQDGGQRSADDVRSEQRA